MTFVVYQKGETAQAGRFDLSDLLGPEPTPIDNRALALRLAAAGKPVFPCRPDKAPLVTQGFHSASTDSGQIERWWKAHPGALVGLPTGATSGLAVLDLDRHRDGQDGIEEIKRLGLDPHSLSPLIVSTPSGGLHLYFRHRPGLTGAASHLPKAVDVRAEGGYVIAPGTVLPNGKRYGAASSFDGLPNWPDQLLPPPRDRADLSDSDTEPVDLQRVKAALAHVDPDSDYSDWTMIGMAIHSATGGSDEGLELWDNWSKGGTKYRHGETRRKWARSFEAGKGVGIGSLFHLAAAHGWVDQRPGIAADDFDDLDELPAHAAGLADWRRLLDRNEEGGIRASPHNVGLIVEHDDRLSGVFATNQLLGKVEIVKRPAQLQRTRAKPPRNLAAPHWRPGAREDVHDAEVRSLIAAPTTQAGYGFNPTREDVVEAIELAARRRAFHPVRDRLRSVTWDGVERVDTLFVDYLGCTDSAYHRAAARLTLLGAVTRIFEPGAKFDFLPIIEGAQGIRKSSFVRTLGLNWSGDPAIGDWGDPKQLIEQTSGLWIVEVPELSAMSRHDVNELKAAISRRNDKARGAYARHERTVERQWIAIGTTNDREYLRDPTGNRRFWPIICGENVIDTDRLQANALQIWAEALRGYDAMRRNQPHGDLPLFMTGTAAAEAIVVQESRRVESAEEVLSAEIEAWLNRPIGAEHGFDDLDPDAPIVLRQATCVAQIWQEMVGRDGSIPPAEALRIGKALGILPGWRKTRGTLAELSRYGRPAAYIRS